MVAYMENLANCCLQIWSSMKSAAVMRNCRLHAISAESSSRILWSPSEFQNYYSKVALKVHNLGTLLKHCGGNTEIHVLLLYIFVQRSSSVSLMYNHKCWRGEDP